MQRRTSKSEQKERGARTLIFSQRNLTSIQPFQLRAFRVRRRYHADIDDAEFVAPAFNPNTRRQWFTKQLAYHTPLRLTPGVKRVPIDKQYDLFFAICGNPTDLLRIASVADWRAKCKKAVCLIDEVWAREVRSYSNYLRTLRQFDLVVLYYSQSVDPIDEVIRQKKCLFLPPGVDAIRFCPYPDPPQRHVDVYERGSKVCRFSQGLLENGQ